jgi:hypothetical protein
MKFTFPILRLVRHQPRRSAVAGVFTGNFSHYNEILIWLWNGTSNNQEFWQTLSTFSLGAAACILASL